MATDDAFGQGSEALMTGSAGNLRCGVCRQLYQQPKLLPCFHTFCTPCLKRLAAPSHTGDTTLSGTSSALKDSAPTKGPNTDRAGRDNSSFPCPTCSEVVFPPPGGVEMFIRNFKMEAALANAQLQPLACEMCDNSSPSVIACVECQKRLCATCQRVHDQMAGTKDHNLISMETSGYLATGQEADGCQSPARKRFCKTNPKHEAEDVAKITAFTVQIEQPSEPYCVEINGEGFFVWTRGQEWALLHGKNTYSRVDCMYLSRRNLEGKEIQRIPIKYLLETGNRLMQPWPERWLICCSGKLQALRNTNKLFEDVVDVTGQGVLSNSSPNGHVYAIHNGGTGCVYEIQLITLDPDGNISVKPFFQVVHSNELQGFDVSADEDYFATVNSFHKSINDQTYLNVEVDVYQRLEAQPFARFTKSVQVESGRKIKDGAVEACLCFSRYKGQEMLRLSVRREDCVYVLDHKKGCSLVQHMNINSPLSLQRDCRERVWICLEDKSIVVFET